MCFTSSVCSKLANLTSASVTTEYAAKLSIICSSLSRASDSDTVFSSNSHDSVSKSLQPTHGLRIQIEFCYLYLRGHEKMKMHFPFRFLFSCFNNMSGVEEKK